MGGTREDGENSHDIDWFLLIIYNRTDAWMTSLSLIQNRFLVAMRLFSKRPQKKSIEGFRKWTRRQVKRCYTSRRLLGEN